MRQMSDGGTLVTFEVEGGKDAAFREMKRIMETCIPLRVPVIADYEIGRNWGEVADPAQWVGMGT